MTMSVQEKINLGAAVFKWVQHTPVGHLKDLSDDDLEMIRQQLIKEVREAVRTLQRLLGTGARVFQRVAKKNQA